MRFYPFGSGSIDLTLAVTASVADYGLTASYATQVFTASRALNGLPGVNGANGQCIYTKGTQGAQGPVGPSGFNGTLSNTFPYP